MKLVGLFILSLYINAPPIIPALTAEVIHEWETSPAGVIFIKREDNKGNIYKVAYPGKHVPCSVTVTREKASTFILLTVRSKGSPDACYTVYKDPLGYVEGSFLLPFIEKTWPIN